MIAILRIALADVARGWRLAAAMVTLIAIPLAGFLILDAIARGGNASFDPIDTRYLVVQQPGGVGEIYGSRIQASLESELADIGAGPAVPEIHSIVGLTVQDATLLRGVDLPRYHEVVSFTISDGRALSTDDDARSAMAGVTLAASAGVGAGDSIFIGGQELTVVGVFEVGTYVDNELWVSLDTARRILGWDDEVSLFIVEEGGPLQVGDQVGDALTVVRRGEVARLGQAWNPIGSLLRLAAGVVVYAGGLILATLLWRLAWLRRRELGILRVFGMPRRGHLAYLGAQAGVIVTAGLTLGVLISVVMASTIRFRSGQFTITPQLDVSTVLMLVAGGALIGLGGALLPMVWLMRTRLATLVRS